jgi:PhnB protein
MTLKPQPHVSFNGNCEAAFRYYEQHLGAQVVSLFTYANSPMANDVPPDWGGKMMHATIEIGGIQLSGADVYGAGYERPRGFEILLGLDDPAAAERIFEALADGGMVQMPLQETFWAVRFGVLVDQFGIPWSINCERVP